MDDDAHFEKMLRRMTWKIRRDRLRHPVRSRDRIVVANSELNAAAVAVVDLIVDEPWFAFDYEAPDAPAQTPLQRALCDLARVAYLPRDDDEEVPDMAEAN